MEFWDLYDGNRKPLDRVILRGKVKRPGEYNIGVEVWTVNSKGEFLLTLRDPRKKEYPNKWENTGGYVVAGESSRLGAVRELFEETGITTTENELIFLGTVKEESIFMDIYMLKCDVAIEEIVLQNGETIDAKWVTLDILVSMIKDLSLALPIGIRLQIVRNEFDRHCSPMPPHDLAEPFCE